MSDWPDDNFGPSGARDFLSIQTARLLATITEIIEDEERCGADDDGESMLMPAVEILSMLCERYDAVPPKPDTVEHWSHTYLAVFDKTIDDVNPPEGYAKRRRRVIENTFRWLASLAETHWLE